MQLQKLEIYSTLIKNNSSQMKQMSRTWVVIYIGLLLWQHQKVIYKQLRTRFYKRDLWFHRGCWKGKIRLCINDRLIFSRKRNALASWRNWKKNKANWGIHINWTMARIWLDIHMTVFMEAPLLMNVQLTTEHYQSWFAADAAEYRNSPGTFWTALQWNWQCSKCPSS